MFNYGYKKREMKKLEEAYKSTKSKVDDVGERCIALAVLRNQSSINIISNFDKHLNSLISSNRAPI